MRRVVAAAFGLLLLVATLKAQTPVQVADTIRVMRDQLAILQPGYNAAYGESYMGAYIDGASNVSQFSRRVYITGWAFRCGSNGIGWPSMDPKPYDVFVVIDGIPYHSYNGGTWLTLPRDDVRTVFSLFCAAEGGVPTQPGIQIDADMIGHTVGPHEVKLRMVRPDGLAFDSNTVTVLRYNGL